VGSLVEAGVLKSVEIVSRERRRDLVVFNTDE
jgi:hypothetical protein